MPASFPAGELLCAVIALRLRYIKPAELASVLHELHAAPETTGLSLVERLTEKGILTPQRRRMVETLRKQHLKLHGGDAEQCLSALGVTDAARAILARGDESELVLVFESLAPSPEESAPDSAPPSEHDQNAAPAEPDSPRAPATLPLGASDSTKDDDDSASSDRFPLGNLATGGVGDPVHRFRTIRPHAKGGLGKISVAEDEQFHRKVALKEIREKHADSPENRARFVREAEITGALEHPGIVPVYALGSFADGRPFYAMRLIRGVSLQTAIDRLHATSRSAAEASTLDARTSVASSGRQKRDGGPHATQRSDTRKFAWRAAQRRSRTERRRELRRLLLRFLIVCETMQYAHSRGVIHRDLKPSNIMLGKYGETLVVDWGLAKTLDYAEFQVEESDSGRRPVATSGGDSSATVAGGVVGTPGFMSPEQALGEVERLGPASDIYSLGATLYCLLTGRPPFLTATLNELTEQVQQDAYPRPREVNPEAPRALEAICLKAMARAPEDRYESAAALAEDIQRWLADEPVTALRETWLHSGARWMRRHRSWTFAAGAALLLMIVVSLAAIAGIDAARQREVKARRNEAIHRQRAETHAQEAERLAASLLLKDVEGLARDRPLGWTWTGLDQLAQAVRMAPEAIEPAKARTLAAACLTSLDLRLVGEYAPSQISHCVAFSPDGRLLAIAASKTAWAESATVTLVEIAAGREKTLSFPRDLLWEVRNGGRTDGGRSLAFSPDGRWLVVGTRSGRLHRWDLRQREPNVASWRPKPGDVEVHEVLFSPEGDSLYAVSRDTRGAGPDTLCTITRWKTSAWTEGPLAERRIRGVVHLAWDGETERLLAGGEKAHWLDPATLEIGRTASAEELGESGHVQRLAGCGRTGFVAGVDEQTPYLLGAGADRIFLWLRDPRLGQGHAGEVRSLDFGRHGEFLVSGANEDGVKVWDVASGSLAVHVPLPGSETTAPAMSSDGRYLASPADRRVVLYEARESKAVETLALQPGVVEAMAVSPGGASLLTAARWPGGSQYVFTWRGADDAPPRAWTLEANGESTAAPQAAFHSPDFAICVPPGGRPHWLGLRANAADSSPKPIDEFDTTLAMIAFSRQGTRFWTVEDEGRVRVWSIVPGNPPERLSLLHEYRTEGLKILTGNDAPLCLATAGRWALVGLNNGLVMAMDGESDDPARLWRTGGNAVQSLSASGDGQWVAAGTDRGGVAVFRVEDGQSVARLDAYARHAVASLALSQSGDLLATASDAGEVRLWRRRDNGYQLLLRLRRADRRRVGLQFIPGRPWLAAIAEGECAVRLWRLDVLESELGRLALGWQDP